MDTSSLLPVLLAAAPRRPLGVPGLEEGCSSSKVTDLGLSAERERGRKILTCRPHRPQRLSHNASLSLYSSRLQNLHRLQGRETICGAML
eukprot:9086859-Pyramimonas_sp.AAC.1